MTGPLEVDLRALFPWLHDRLPTQLACFAVATDRDPLHCPQAARLLGADLDRVATWRSLARRCHYYAGRRAAHRVALEFGWDATVDTDPRGAPFLETSSGPEHLTITHSGSWALAASAPGQIFGMDYEVGLAGRAHIRRRVCGAGELAIHDLVDPETPARTWALGCIWTLKEALFKAYGVGLVAELKDVEVGPVSPRGEVVVRALRGLHEEIPHPLPAGLYAGVQRFDGHPLAIVGCAEPDSA